MSNTNTGGPAFPFGQVSEETGQPINGYHNDGMTLRDYFASKAMPSLYKDYAECARSTGWDEQWQMGIAMDAYALADSMLKAREQ